MRDAQRARQSDLIEIYRRLLARFGDAGWWPGQTSFEVCLGAILTQNTSWINVEKALGVLRHRRLLNWQALRNYTPRQLAPLIRSSGYYRVKARRVVAFLRFLGKEYGGRAARMAEEPTDRLRRKLLSVDGIGPETADSIALYAAGKPLFVVDAYTRRVFSRLGFLAGREDYKTTQRFFMRSLPADPALFNDYHAQIVRLAKDMCRSRPQCALCPLDSICLKRSVAALPE